MFHWQKISPIGNRFLPQTVNTQKRRDAISPLSLVHKYNITKYLVIENNLVLKAESDYIVLIYKEQQEEIFKLKRY